jgi:hypothetical protein
MGGYYTISYSPLRPVVSTYLIDHSGQCEEEGVSGEPHCDAIKTASTTNVEIISLLAIT